MDICCGVGGIVWSSHDTHTHTHTHTHSEGGCVGGRNFEYTSNTQVMESEEKRNMMNWKNTTNRNPNDDAGGAAP